MAVGARFSDRVTGKITNFAPNAKVIHIDVDPAEIGKNIRVDVPVVGDAKNALLSLLKEISPSLGSWSEKIVEWKKDHPSAIPPRYVGHQAPVCD